MSPNCAAEESSVLKFVQDFFICFDKNRHVLHSLFPLDGTLIILGNRVDGHQSIQQAMLSMVSTTHHLISVDVQNLPLTLQPNLTIYQVLCAGDVVFGNDPQVQGFCATLIVSFQKPNIVNVITFNERCQWPNLS